MDALAGYGSESDSAVEDPSPRHGSETDSSAVDDPPPRDVDATTATSTATGGVPALLGLLPEDDEDDHDHDERNDGAATNGRGDEMRAPPTSDSDGGNGAATIDDGGDPTSNGAAAVDVEEDDDGGDVAAAVAGGGGGGKRRRRRRWDDPCGGSGGGVGGDDNDGGGVRSPLPPPDPPPTADDHPSGSHPRDRTARLRDWLSGRVRAQRERSSAATGGGCVWDGDDDDRSLRRLGEKLETLHDRFHGRKQRGGGDGADDDGGAYGAQATVPSSFSAHLKSQREFGNPHLLGTIVEHFQIWPLESNAGNSFKGFEYADRLMAAEERARIARAAIYDAGMADGTGGMPAGSGA